MALAYEESRGALSVGASVVVIAAECVGEAREAEGNTEGHSPTCLEVGPAVCRAASTLRPSEARVQPDRRRLCRWSTPVGTPAGLLSSQGAPLMVQTVFSFRMTWQGPLENCP